MLNACGRENTLEKIKEEVEKRKEECKNKMRSNPWQLRHPNNEINFEPLIPCIS